MSGFAEMALAMWAEKSVVPSLGHPSITICDPGSIFSLTIRMWSNALRP